jgi:hypothetical protein
MATISEKRDVRDFNEVALQGYGELLIEQNPDAPESLVIEADQEIMSRLSSEVRGGRLILGFDMAWYDWLGWGLEWLFTPNKAIRYHLSMKQINSVAVSGSADLSSARIQSGMLRLAVSGAGKIRIGEIQAEALSTAISGSGDVEVGAGAVARHELHVSGSGAVRMPNVQTQETRISISGSGSAQIDASKVLDVHISGAGDVRYKGTPTLTQRISGAGSIRTL